MTDIQQQDDDCAVWKVKWKEKLRQKKMHMRNGKPLQEFGANSQLESVIQEPIVVMVAFHLKMFHKLKVQHVKI